MESKFFPTARSTLLPYLRPWSSTGPCTTPTLANRSRAFRSYPAIRKRGRGVSLHGIDNVGFLLQTDAAGRFQWQPEETVSRIIAAHPDGYSETTPAALLSDPTVRLQAWGRIEGSFKSSAKTLEPRTLMLEFENGSY